MSTDFVFFWKHQDHVVDAGAFSQWAPWGFEVEGVSYPTAEHFMMAEKARLFEDPERLAQILKTPSPRRAKSLGRKVEGFDDEVWKRERLEIVERGNLAKFRAHAPLRELLLSTGEQTLVEASPYDRVWGIGLKAEDPRASEPERWKGQNLLGVALMRVREALRE